MDIKVNLEGLPLTPVEIESTRGDAAKAMDQLWSGDVPMTGWVKAPMNQDQEMLERILNVADIIRDEAELLLVIGIGGSYMGAKAAIEALPRFEQGTEVRFLGINFCNEYYREILEEVKRKNTIVCAISKSGNTMEIRAALEIIKPVMEEKYGSREEAAKRIIAVTDETSGSLRAEADEMGYVTFPIQGDIGGRFSVLTPVGLLPMAAAGIDIREVLRGAEAVATSPLWDTTAADYAIARYLMNVEKGKAVEAVAFSHSRLAYFGEWLKQLFGESEGKEGKGLWPASLQYSTDLHSMGQFLQQGSPVFFETVVTVEKTDQDIVVPAGPQKGMTLGQLNDAMVRGVIKAHKDGGVPVCEIRIPELNAYTFGQMIYFMEMTCGITAMLLGVNPFDQPGVEDYKREMRKNCGLEG